MLGECAATLLRSGTSARFAGRTRSLGANRGVVRNRGRDSRQASERTPQRASDAFEAPARLPARVVRNDVVEALAQVGCDGRHRYALSRWDALARFVDDGHIEIGNNAAERSLRGVALGRKNYLFAGSDTGGERATAIHSLIGSAKLNDLNPEAYLQQVLTRIADHPISRITELLPWNFNSVMPQVST